MSSNRLSFGQKLQSLSDTFYSTILEDSKERKSQIKNVKQLEDFETCEDVDFTFDQCSTSRIRSTDDFSFTFHSIDQPSKQIERKHQTTRIKHSSTPYSIRKENFETKEQEQDETIAIEHGQQSQPIIIGYYPVISYQPVCIPPTIYLSNEQIQSQIDHYSTLNKKTLSKK